LPARKRNYHCHFSNYITNFIYYTFGENTGFIPLTVSVLSINERSLSNLNLYPNPTTGELKIDNGELTINNIEVFDIYGRKILSNHLITLSSHQKIDISHLQSGIYFLKVGNKIGRVVKL